MRIVFIGVVEFSKHTLLKLIDLKADVVGVCTKNESTFNSDFADLGYICKQNSIPCHYFNDINSQDSIKWIRELKPDIIFCFGLSSLLKDEILKLAPLGVIGFHPAKLPQNRGRHPLIWALALGLKSTASTFFFMDSGADSGDILSQKSIKISQKDDANTLYTKVIDTALKQISEFLPLLESGNFKRIKQNEKLSNIWRKRSKLDGCIDFRMSSLGIYNLVRALTKPYAGASLIYKDKDIKIWKATIVKNNQKNIESGKILRSNKRGILVKTYDGAINLIKHDFEILPKVGEYL